MFALCGISENNKNPAAGLHDVLVDVARTLIAAAKDLPRPVRVSLHQSRVRTTTCTNSTSFAIRNEKCVQSFLSGSNISAHSYRIGLGSMSPPRRWRQLQHRL